MTHVPECSPIAGVLTDAIEQINRHLWNPNLNWLHTGQYLDIIKVRMAMAQLREDLLTQAYEREHRHEA